MKLENFERAEEIVTEIKDLDLSLIQRKGYDVLSIGRRNIEDIEEFRPEVEILKAKYYDWLQKKRDSLQLVLEQL